jgi:hypothetical protein
MSSSDVSTVATVSRSGLVARRSSVDINIHGHYNSKVYTSGTSISGEVTVTPWRDTHFDYVQIVLLGTTWTRLDALQVPQHSSHTFLKLAMPVPESAYPVPRVMEAGHTYTIPFNFVVPSHLTVGACTHHAQSDVIRDMHMRLPPSMAGQLWDRDDLAPEMAQVEYAIKARVLREPDHEHGRPIKLMEAHQALRVLPASSEDPPLGLTKHDRGYCLSKTKSLRRSLFSGKIGRLTATAAQPTAVVVSADGRSASTSSAVVALKYEPSSSSSSADGAPPKVNTVSAKLVATTYFSATPMTRLPNLGSGKYDFGNDQRLSYSTSVNLFSTSVDKVSWRQQIAAQARRDSGYASDGNDTNNAASGGDSDNTSNTNNTSQEAVPLRTPKKKSSSSSSPVFHTATLAIPFKLPTSKKMFLPTFHSCLISRVYTLQLTLSVGSSSNTSVSLALPLQIAVDAGAASHSLGLGGLPSFDSVMALQEEEEVDDMFRPRRLLVPDEEFQGNSVLPGYEDMAGFRRRSMRA